MGTQRPVQHPEPTSGASPSSHSGGGIAQNASRTSQLVTPQKAEQLVRSTDPGSHSHSPLGEQTSGVPLPLQQPPGSIS